MKSLLKSLSATLMVALLASGSAAIAADGAPKFSNDFDEASALAKETGKPLITIFSASWCPPCQQMKNSVYPSSTVKPYHDDFVWAYLDTDDPKNSSLKAKFGVSGIPHIAFVNADGSRIGYFSGAVAPEGFTNILDQVLDDAKKSEKTSS